MALVQRAKGLTASQQRRLRAIGRPSPRKKRQKVVTEKLLAKPSKKIAVGQIGLTGEDIFRLQKAGKLTSEKIEALAKKRKFRSTYITRSGTAESTIKARTAKEIRQGSLRTKGGLSVIGGVLVPSNQAGRLLKIINREKLIKRNLEQRKLRLQQKARDFLARNEKVPKQLQEEIKEVKKQEEIVIPKRLQKNIEKIEARKKKLLKDIKEQSEKRRISFVDQPVKKAPKRLTLKGLKTEAELFTLSFVQQIVNTGIALKNPQAAAKGFVDSVKNENIGNTLKSIKQDIQKNPVGALGEFAAGALLFRSFGKLTKPLANTLKSISKVKKVTPNLNIFKEKGRYNSLDRILNFEKLAKINPKTGKGTVQIKIFDNQGKVIKTVKESVDTGPRLVLKPGARKVVKKITDPIVKSINKVQKAQRAIKKTIKRPIVKVKKAIKISKETLSKTNAKIIKDIRSRSENLGIEYRFRKNNLKTKIKTITKPTLNKINSLIDKINKALRKSKGVKTNRIKNLIDKLNIELKIANIKTNVIFKTVGRKITKKISKVKQKVTEKRIKLTKPVINKLESIKKQFNAINLELKFNKLLIKTKISKFTQSRKNKIDAIVKRIKKKLKKEVDFNINIIKNDIARLKKIFDEIGVSIKVTKIKIKTPIIKIKRKIIKNIDSIINIASKNIKKLGFEYKFNKLKLKNLLDAEKRRISINAKIKKGELKEDLLKLNNLLKKESKKLTLKGKKLLKKIERGRIKRLINKIKKVIPFEIKKIRTITPAKEVSKQFKALKIKEAKAARLEEKAKTRKVRLEKQKKLEKTLRNLKISKKIAKGLQVKQVRNGLTFKDIQTGKIRVFNSRKKFVKALKEQNKFLETPEGKKLLKLQKKIERAKTRKSRLDLQKERLRLRREQKIETKIKKGLQVKAERKLPTSKGFPFEDKITGQIIYFKSRKNFLRAVKRQAKAARPKRVNLENFFDNNNLIQIGLEDKIILLNLKGKKVLEILKRANSLKPINIPKKIKKVKKKRFDKNKLKRLPKKKFKAIQKGEQILIVKTKIKPRRVIRVKDKTKVRTVRELKAKLKPKPKKRLKAKQKVKKRPELKTKKVRAKVKQKAKIIIVLKDLVEEKAKQRQKQIQKQAQEQKQIQLQEIKLAQELKLKQRQIQKPALKPKAKTRSKQKIKQIQKIKLKLKQKLKQIKKTKKQLILMDKKIEEETKKAFKRQKKSKKFIFTPDLFAKLTNAKATPTERKKLLKLGKTFTGLEVRKLI